MRIIYILLKAEVGVHTTKQFLKSAHTYIFGHGSKGDKTMADKLMYIQIMIINPSLD